MRIISKHKDYYDSAAGYGVDTTIVYDRTSKMLPSQSTLEDEQDDVRQHRDIVAACETITNKDHFQHLFPSYHPHNYAIYVGVAGKIYVGLNLHVKTGDPKKEIFQRGLWGDSFDDLIVWHPYHLTAKQLAEPTGSRWMTNGAKTAAEWFANNEGKRVVENLDLFTKYNMVSFVARRPQGSQGYIVELNPQLQQFGFQKMLDSFTTFQEISMFVTGVLAQKDQMSNTATDKELLYARGHDDMSFKTPPTKKR